MVCRSPSAPGKGGGNRSRAGVTSRVILEAMSLNGSGHLWSLDLPHPFRPELHTQTAAAVPIRHAEIDGHMSEVRAAIGSHLLSPVCEEIDMFVHDSLHTGRNMRFELRTVWPAMHDGDLALVDDVSNQSFRDFVREVGEPPSMVLRSADGPCMFGAIRKARPADHDAVLSAAAGPSRIVSPPVHSTTPSSLPITRPDFA